jgi:hypothetical protein
VYTHGEPGVLREIALAALMILATTVIHTGGMLLAMRLLKSKLARQAEHVYCVGAIIVLMFLVAFLQVSIWALAYVLLGALDNFYDAVYFSMVTFTTLGYGDIVPDGQWRLLASSQAANGIIMFGWTTAIVIATVQRVYFRNLSEE